MDDKTVRRRKQTSKTSSRGSSGRSERSSEKVKKSWSWRIPFFSILSLLSCAVLYGFFTSPIETIDMADIVDVPLSGVYEPNKSLSKGKKIYNLPGPECIEEDKDGNLYTGLDDGRIVKIKKSSDGRIGEGDLEVITNGVFPHRSKTAKDEKHGRPLGFRIRNGILFVVDGVHGFYTVDLITKVVKFLLKPEDANPSMLMPNDLDISADGKVAYLTDTSSRFGENHLGYLLAAGQCDGRVFQYEFATKRLKTVVSDLCFANGVQLSKDEKTLVVAETTRYRVKFFDTKTWKVKKVVHTPILPDNIRLNSRDTYVVAGGSIPTLTTKLLSRLPVMRQALAGLLSHDQLKQAIFMTLKIEHGMAIEMDENGNVVQTLHDPNGDMIVGLSQVTELSDGRLAIGSFFGNHLGLVDV